jgi:uncharacterized protein (DUF1800 family)
MKRFQSHLIPRLSLAATSIVMLCSALYQPPHAERTAKFPYKQAGLTERQAAAHLISRFTYGATPGEVDAAVQMGLENWFQKQLNANLEDDTLNLLLDQYDALKLSNTEVVNKYPKRAQLLRMAMREGAIDTTAISKADKNAYKEALTAYLEKKGLRPERELVRQFVNQKILRAVYSHNQLQEVLTEFWFNHFNVSFTKKDCAPFIPAYERDVIRPNALGKFETLLTATAKSRAMLLYLDNFSSAGTNTEQPQGNRNKKNPAAKNKRPKGLNENYAREIMELHTLGVDGGYSQNDVTEAARILTGWTVYPMSADGYGSGMKKALLNADENKLRTRGFVHEGDFLFAANRHDIGPKTVLGKRFAPQGYHEGMQFLTLLAHHPSTATHISKKIAVRFVNDTPSQSLLDQLEKTFIKDDGDIRKMLLTLVSSPEFWSASALREKTKSPFELAISAIRGLNAEVNQPYQLFNWITRMGQKIYFYQAPTGFPDKGQHWINTGSLLTRMNFGLALASGRIPGVRFDLLKLNHNHEPESAVDALTTYSKLLMPERNMDETLKRLTPLLNDPDLQKKVDDAAKNTDKTQVSREEVGQSDENMLGDSIMASGNDIPEAYTSTKKQEGKYRLSQVIGIILGSPEFQRR